MPHDGPDTAIPVAIELGEEMVRLASPELSERCRARVLAGLEALIARLGIEGTPKVTVRLAATRRGMRVRVHGVLRPYPPSLLRRAWVAAVPEHLRTVPMDVGGHGADFPDGWFKAFVARQPGDAATAACDVLARLALAVVEERPGCLLGPAQAASYRDGLPAAESSGIADHALQTMLTMLLDAGVSVADRPRVLRIASHSQALGRSTSVAAEAVLPHLRTGVRIRAHPADLLRWSERETEPAMPTLDDPTPPGSRAAILLVIKELREELGVDLLEPWFEPAPELAPGMAAVAADAWNGLPMPVLEPGELLVDARGEQVAALGLHGARAALHPDGARACTIVSAEHGAAVAHAGLVSWSRAEWLALFVAVEIRRMVDRLLSLEEVEHRLAELNETHFELVQAALERHDPVDLVELLRGLLREGLSARDLPLLLERLLQYDAIPADGETAVVLDHRLPLMTPSEAALGAAPAQHLAFTRRGLRLHLAQRCLGSRAVLPVLRLEPEFEARVRAATAPDGAAPGEAEQEAMRDAVWSVVAPGGVPMETPVLVLGPATRAATRALLSPEMPGLPVIARDELPTWVTVQTVSTVGLGSAPQAA